MVREAGVIARDQVICAVLAGFVTVPLRPQVMLTTSSGVPVPDPIERLAMGQRFGFVRIAALALTASMVLAGCASLFATRVEVVADLDTGTFTVTSNADECLEGTHAQSRNVSSGSGDVAFYEFVCADGSGTFVLRVEYEPAAETESTGTEGIGGSRGTWTVAGGTDDYSGLEGSGTVVVEFDPGATATYSGDVSSSTD